MAFVRSHKTKDYTVMSNHHLNDSKLSLKGKGLLSFMLSKPDNWEFSVSGLQSQLKEGRDAVRSTLIELEELSYIFRKRIPLGSDGGSTVEYHIFEKPTRKSESPTVESPMLGNPTQVNTNNKVNTEYKLNYIHQNESFDVEHYKYICDGFKLPEKKKEKSSAKKEKEFDSEVYDCFGKCVQFFDVHLHPQKGQINKWLDCIDKLNRIDGIPYDVIVEIVRWARNDDFWSKNFLSLLKLRTKDKNDVKYAVSFHAKMKPKTNKVKSFLDVTQQVLNDLDN